MPLKRLLELVRYGDAARPDGDASVKPLARAIEDEIAQTEREVTHDSLDRLRFLALRAEARYSFGSRQRASDAEALWNESRALRAEFDRWAKGDARQLNYPYDDLKARLWVLMSAFFYHAFMIGDAEYARVSLKTLERCVDQKLRPLDKRRSASGFCAKLNELLAQIHRTEGSFSDAQVCASRAIELVGARLFEHTPDSCTAEERVRSQVTATIATARILGGLGRLAFLQGRFKDALQHWRSALSMLPSAGNPTLLRLVSSHILVSMRRAADPLSAEWRRDLDALRVAFVAFGGDRVEALDVEREETFDDEKLVYRCLTGDHSRDLDGQRRVAYEIALAHVEAAELSIETRDEQLDNAEPWLQRLKALGEDRTHSLFERNVSMFRFYVLSMFASVLSDKLEIAKIYGEKARRLEPDLEPASIDFVKHDRLELSKDFAGCDCLELDLAQCFVDCHDSKSNLDHTEIKLRELFREAQPRNDYEDMAEAYLRLVLIKREKLEGWMDFGNRIENGFLLRLHRLAIRVATGHFSYTFAGNDPLRELTDVQLKFLEWNIETKGKKIAAEEFGKTTEWLEDFVKRKKKSLKENRGRQKTAHKTKRKTKSLEEHRGRQRTARKSR